MPHSTPMARPARHSSLIPWIGAITMGFALWALLVCCTWQVYFLDR